MNATTSRRKRSSNLMEIIGRSGEALFDSYQFFGE